MKNIWSSQNWNREKQEKDLMKIDHLKKEIKCFAHQWQRKLKGEQSLYHLVSKWKTKGTKYERY